MVEIGSGLGTYALMAEKAGASRVDAIESNPLAVALAREMGVERSGKIHLVEEEASRFRPEKRADVVIFEDFGAFGYFPGMFALFDHVVRRMAAERARYVPAGIELFAAPTDLTPTRAFHRAEELPFLVEAMAMLRKRMMNHPVELRTRASKLVACKSVNLFWREH